MLPISSRPVAATSGPAVIRTRGPTVPSSLDTSGAVTTIAAVIGRDARPACSGVMPSTSWKWKVR